MLMRVKHNSPSRCQCGCVVLAAMALMLVASLTTAQDVASTPTPTPHPDPNVIILDLSPEEDPNAPGLAREERFRRQKIMIQRQLEEWNRREELKKQGLWPPPTPTPTPEPTPTTTDTLATTGTQVTTQTLAEQAGLGLVLQEGARRPFVTFFLWPASHSVRPGEQFATQCRLLNPDHLPVDRVRIVLNYRPAYMRPAAIHQSDMRSLLGDAEPECRLDEAAGRLIYEARLGQVVTIEEVALITIVWEARAPIQATRISPWADDAFTGVYFGDRLLNESVLGVRNALAGAQVRVIEPDTVVPQGERMLERTLAGMGPLMAGLPDQTTLRRPTLWLDQPADAAYEPDQWVVVDVGVNNPDAMAFDELRLALKFDPEVVEVVDADRGNWIGQGTNILDGPFHKRWPWDIHYVNHVNAERGRIEYRVATTALREQPSGTLVRVFLRVRKPTRAPLLRWVWSPEDQPDRPGTGLFLFGENVLTRGRDGGWAAGLADVRVGAQHEAADPDAYRHLPETFDAPLNTTETQYLP